jgi:penicillin amidase
MSGSLARACLVFFTLTLTAACRQTAPAPAPEPQPPQTSGDLQVSGLHGPVTVARDAWGIPHITASDEHDLFMAQGFVQAQDRLFQMDLWKKTVQGRLSEVLGANFIDRDAMTRRVQFRGDIDREWASYGPDTHEIAVAFTSGINAWVRQARVRWPEDFVLAGWEPEYWRPEDLLNRTDAFLASGNALDDLLRARLAAAIGTARAAQILPVPGGQAMVDRDIDLSAITYVVPDTIRRIGTAPFFLTLAAPASAAPRPSQRAATELAPLRNLEPSSASLPSLPNPASLAWAIDAGRSATSAPFVAVQGVHPFDVPAARYLVHLTAPGFDVAGATAPWLPGVAIGHNARIAWAFTRADVDTQDVFVEHFNPADPHQVERDGRWVDLTIDHERVSVKGRARPFEYDRMYTANGVVIAIDRDRHLLYTLGWSGTAHGGAAELAAVAVDRASSWTEFQAALTRWRTPAAEFVYADVDGNTRRVTAGLVPRRPSGTGTTVTAGWRSANRWQGWRDLTADSRESQAASTAALIVGSAPAIDRAASLLSREGRRTADGSRAVQIDVHSSAAARLLSLLAAVRSAPPDLEPVRARLTAWSGEMLADAPEAQTYMRWNAALRRLIVAPLMPAEFVGDVAVRIDLVDLLTRPRQPWFEEPRIPKRDALLIQALAAAAAEQPPPSSADASAAAADATMTFEHPLAVFDAARRRFDVGPFKRPGSYDTPFASDRRRGPTLRAVFDLSDWDRSRALVAPGQSGAPSSPHYDDLAAVWARGEAVALPFTAAAVKGATKETLQLTPW